MNAKELRKAAELTKSFANEVIQLCQLHDIPMTNMSTVDANLAIAEHILATVRDDDDDPVTESEIDNATGSYNRLSVTKTTVTHYDKPAGKRLCVAISEDDGDLVLIEGCKTMAQFRALLFGLGIPRKEST